MGHEDCWLFSEVVAEVKSSFVSLAVFQPEEETCQRRVESTEAAERGADLTPTSGVALIRRNRIITGGNLLRSTLLLHSPSVLVLNDAATALTRSALSTFIVSDVQPSPLACQLPFFGRRNGTGGPERWTR